jgi:hypothetical protein
VVKRDPETRKQDRERSKRYRELQKEKSALLVELLGVDVEKQRMKEEGIQQFVGSNRQLEYLPEAKREPVTQYLEKFDEKMQDFYARASGNWDAETRAEQKKLEAEKFGGLAEILAPQEMREFELRNSQMASQISSEIRGVTLTPEEYEALYDVRKKYGDSIYNWADAVNDATAREQIERNQKNLQAEVAEALGAPKARELELAKDYTYQQLVRLAKRNDLPPETASRVYDFKDAAEKAAKELNGNTSVGAEQRSAALQQIRAEAETAVKNALGDKAYKRYLSNGGWWLNNIAPMRPPPSAPSIK